MINNKFNANEWFVENSNDENIPNKSEKLEGNTVNPAEKPVVWESYEDELEEMVVLNNENATVTSNTHLTKKRQGIKFKAWQILCALLAVVISIMSVFIFMRNKPTVAVDYNSAGESKTEQLSEIADSISDNTQEENADETETNEEDSTESDGQTKGNNATSKSEYSVDTTKEYGSLSTNSGSNTSKSTTEVQVIDPYAYVDEVCVGLVAGKPESVARQELKDFNIITEYCYSEHTPSGYVVDCYGDNSPSRYEKKGSTITMFISKGKGDDAWSEWSETHPTGSDIAYLDNYDSNGHQITDNVGDGKGILVERKYCYRYRTVYKDSKGNIVEAGAWSKLEDGSAHPEFVGIADWKNGNYGYLQQENVTLYRWRIDYLIVY